MRPSRMAASCPAVSVTTTYSPAESSLQELYGAGRFVGEWQCPDFGLGYIAGMAILMLVLL